MSLHTLPKVTSRGQKRRGRGVGSGKGFHTTGRGQKGQGARTSVGILFEGVKTKKSLLHRLPMLRGKGKFKSIAKPYAVSVDSLENHPAGEVTLKSLIEHKIIGRKEAKQGIKFVGSASLSKKFTVKLPGTSGAMKSVSDAGGTMI